MDGLFVMCDDVSKRDDLCKSRRQWRMLKEAREKEEKTKLSMMLMNVKEAVDGVYK